MVADLNPRERVYAWLLDEGWVVGMTSYGVEGLAIARGQADVLNLRDHALSKMEPDDEKHVILEAESMGGAIATFLAELPMPNPFTVSSIASIEAVHSFPDLCRLCLPLGLR